ncbi:alpha/beta hydrolase [Microbacterium thalassium]|uniref:Alpha-beta hydrolase superfamily lysophospholipase n=1 Tax=Microbacterium thalassium TaxID=362649 RepID=A0A7X0FSI1_9MICO|nr:alpha/beta hydrolase [Microbacterium thalassium]MBB6392923.1 alpha-beta hydrolase superfamily lysophospholipase [Microbacterium thalassium]GLK22846.1 lysophospholipase [Microbacterium thalassium]
MAGDWTPDILGDGFEQRTLALEDDDQGPVVATLVRSIPSWFESLGRPLADVDVLYVHGWSDYFFQVELAAFWTGLGARFHALDLRRYGRSLRDGQTPGYVSSLDLYDQDIEAALAAIGHAADAVPKRRLVLLGHSTGGLTLTLWAARHPGRASALILNSPWLELQVGAMARQTIEPIVGIRARLDPLGAHPLVDYGFYTRAQRELGTLPAGQERLAWRPELGFPTHPGWLSAVLEGHRRIAEGVDVGCPALVLLSTRTTVPFAWAPEMTASDSVLVVDDIARSATRIGRLITIARIDAAVHDVFLSAPEPRQEAYRVMREWVRGIRL